MKLLFFKLLLISSINAQAISSSFFKVTRGSEVYIVADANDSEKIFAISDGYICFSGNVEDLASKINNNIFTSSDWGLTQAKVGTLDKIAFEYYDVGSQLSKTASRCEK